MLDSASAATDLDLISDLMSIPDAGMQRGVRFPAWYLLLVALLGIVSGCQRLRDLERFTIRHHSALTKALGLELRRPSSWPPSVMTAKPVPNTPKMMSDKHEIKNSWHHKKEKRPYAN